jgi:hypothetical protein
MGKVSIATEDTVYLKEQTIFAVFVSKMNRKAMFYNQYK